MLYVRMKTNEEYQNEFKKLKAKDLIFMHEVDLETYVHWQGAVYSTDGEKLCKICNHIYSWFEWGCHDTCISCQLKKTQKHHINEMCIACKRNKTLVHCTGLCCICINYIRIPEANMRCHKSICKVRKHPEAITVPYNYNVNSYKEVTEYMKIKNKKH